MDSAACGRRWIRAAETAAQRLFTQQMLLHAAIEILVIPVHHILEERNIAVWYAAAAAGFYQTVQGITRILVEHTFHNKNLVTTSCSTHHIMVQCVGDSSTKGGASMKYKRTRQAKWDRRQLRTLTTKVRQADRDAFVDACYKTGKSPYATLRQFVLDYAYGGKAKTPTPTPEPVEVFWGM